MSLISLLPLLQASQNPESFDNIEDIMDLFKTLLADLDLDTLREFSNLTKKFDGIITEQIKQKSEVSKAQKQLLEKKAKFNKMKKEMEAEINELELSISKPKLSTNIPNENKKSFKTMSGTNCTIIGGDSNPTRMPQNRKRVPPYPVKKDKNQGLKDMLRAYQANSNATARFCQFDAMKADFLEERKKAEPKRCPTHQVKEVSMDELMQMLGYREHTSSELPF